MSESIQKTILKNSKPLLAEENGHVYQVWDDGEITLQKSGDLLWERNLHCMQPALEHYATGFNWPDDYNGHGFIFTDQNGTEEVRKALSV